MKNYFFKALIFAMPFFLYCLLIIVIDPYNFFNYSHIIKKEIKLKMLDRTFEKGAIGNIIWKRLEFNRNPSGYLIFGDSQAYNINEQHISECSGCNVMNMSVPGANPETKFRLFWLAANQLKLKHVTIQLDFPNLFTRTNLFQASQEYINKPYLYFSDANVCRDAYNIISYVIWKKYTRKYSAYAFPITEKKNEAFDKIQKNNFRNYSYPTNYYAGLSQISEYCHSNNITLDFIVFPIHQRYLDFLSKNNIMIDYDRFITDISKLARTFDFSRNRDINNNEKNFIDYFHPTQQITDSLTCIVWRETELTANDQP